MNATDPAPSGVELLPFEQARRAFERDYLVRLLHMTRGNVTHAARLARRNRTEFYRLLERHALSPGMFKPSPRRDSCQGGLSAKESTAD